MITLSSEPFKIIKFSFFKVVDPPNFLLKYNMADVRLSLRECLPTFQKSWDHVILQHLRCGLGIPHLHSCGIGRCGNGRYISSDFSLTSVGCRLNLDYSSLFGFFFQI